jgi:hypothetical protein
MKIHNFKDYNNMNEFVNYLTEDELLEMSNITQETSGIKDVIIWIGPNPPQHGRRIKVSNKPNSFDGNDCFTITIPKFEIIGDVNKKLIDKSVMSEIIEFVKLNMDTIIEYSDRKLSTLELLKTLKMVK